MPRRRQQSKRREQPQPGPVPARIIMKRLRKYPPGTTGWQPPKKLRGKL